MTRRGMVALFIALAIGVAAIASRTEPMKPDCMQTVTRCAR